MSQDEEIFYRETAMKHDVKLIMRRLESKGRVETYNYDFMIIYLAKAQANAGTTP
jgi:hypothetical protein